MKRIMYIEFKGDDVEGPGRIGWVELSRSRRACRYGGKLLHKVAGYKYNCVEADTQERYWVSGPKRDGQDRLYGGVVEIDEDARQDYWLKIRRMPASVNERRYRS